MTLRLVLVSLVAALGLTIPGAPVIENWVASTQNWMNARFADWDTRNPQTMDTIIVSDTYDVEQIAPRLPIPSPLTAPPAVERPTVELAGPPRALALASAPAVKPVAVEGTMAAQVPVVSAVRQGRTEIIPLLGKLAQKARRVVLRCTTIVSAAVPRVVFPAAPRAFPPLVAGASPRGIAELLNELNEGIGIRPQMPTVAARKAASPARSRRVGDQPFGSMEQSASLYFAGEIQVAQPGGRLTKAGPVKNPRMAATAKAQHVAARPTAGKPEPAKLTVTKPVAAKPVTAQLMASQPPTSAPVVPHHAARPQLVAEAQEDLDIESAGELVRLEDGFGLPGATVLTGSKVRPLVPHAATAPQPAVLPSRTVAVAIRPGFDPLEVPTDFYAGIAFELNQMSDGIRPEAVLVRTAKTDSPAPSGTHELRRAVRLTRDAVYAWVNVLTGPALMTVSQSN